MLATADAGSKILGLFSRESLMGFCVGIITALVLWIILKICISNSNRKQVLVFEDGDQGSFSITISALKAFVLRLTEQFEEVSLVSVDVYNARAGRIMDIVLKAKDDVDLSATRKKLRDMLFSELAAKLGLVNQIAKINIQIKSFEKSLNENTENS